MKQTAQTKPLNHLIAWSIILALSGLVTVYLLDRIEVDFNLSQATGGTCAAHNLDKFRTCMGMVASGEADNVELLNLITCSGADTCNFSLNNISRPVKIYGAPNSGAGFRRVDSYTYSIFNVSNSNGVSISNLLFDEVAGNACPENCGSTISVWDSSVITLADLTILSSKVMGVAVSKTQKIAVRNSVIHNAAVFGMWFSNDLSALSSEVAIENNLFKDNKSNAILFAASSPATSPSVIRNNTFLHNHRDVIFFVCGSGTDPCSGGQLLIEQGTRNLRIENNVIKDGKIDAYDARGYHASGIEFTNHNAHDVVMAGNDIHGNTGTGIVANLGITDISNISITGNKLYANGNNIDFPGAEISGNCFTANCLTLLSGAIYADPNPCALSSAQSLCSSQIIWSSNDAADAKVLAGDEKALFSTNTSDLQTASWIGEQGAVFYLYAGDSLLDSVFVRGLDPSKVASPPPPAATGNISASPTPCKFFKGQKKCASTISWSTSNAVNPQVRYGGTVFATGASGSKDAAFITASGITFNLYSGSTLLGSVSVKGVK